jgi:chromosome segregation ATPase
MDSRVQLKSRFAVGQRIGEADFASLIDSLAHLNDDVSSGALATGQQVTTLSDSIAALQTLANSTKDEFDAYKGTHPSLAEVQALQLNTEQTIGADMTALSNALTANTQTNQESIQSIQGTISANKSDADTRLSALEGVTNGISSTYATVADLSTREVELQNLIEAKADAAHSHSEYLTNADISDFITLSEVPVYAPVSHGHDASEITGLNDLFMTPDETLQMINDNKETLSIDAILQQGFYTKSEVEQKFYVARWRTDQISLFTPSVQDIVQPMLDGATDEIKVSIANVRAEEVAKDNAVRALISSTRGELEVSINNTKSALTLEENTREQADLTLQSNIDSTAQNASASIASSQANVLSQLANVRAEVLAETSSNDGDITALQGRATSLETRATDLEAKDTSLDSDISGLQGQIDTANSNVSQTLVDAKAYTDTEINELLNGAGDAYNTLKELQDHITSNESSAAEALTAEVNGLQTQIDGNDFDITAVENRATALESAVGSLQAKDTSLDGNISVLQSQIDTNDSDITALQGRATTLESRATTLESRATSLEAQDVSFQQEIDIFKTTYDNLTASNQALTTAYNDLLARVTNLENTAYAQAGYVFP